MKKGRMYLELMKEKAKLDSEYLVSKYFSLALPELRALRSPTVRTYLPELELATIVNLRNNIYKVKIDYWRARIARRPWIIPDYGIEFVMINPGTAMLGSPDSDKNRDDDEVMHEVVFDKPFWFGKFEISQEQYKKVMGLDPSSFPALRLNNPVEMVSWLDAAEFCRKLTEHERAVGQLSSDMEYRLPTEGEWEYVCRAGTTTIYNTGDSISFALANFSGDGNPEVIGPGKFRRGTNKIGLFKPNAWGVYDMHGNVSEWCYDVYQQDVTDQNYAGSSKIKSARGGSWFDTDAECRSASRDGYDQAAKFDSIGIRVLLGEKLTDR